MRIFLTVFLVLFSGCSTPSVRVMGGAKGTADVGPYTFVVRYKGTRAEAYRTNKMLRPKAREVFAAGAAAIEQVSGCHAVRNSVRGDVAIIEADILC